MHSEIHDKVKNENLVERKKEENIEKMKIHAMQKTNWRLRKQKE